MTNHDELNEAIATNHGMTLLKAEINFAIASVIGLQHLGTLCYHGIHLPVPVLRELLVMKAEGFVLTDERFANHVKIMACHSLVHNTDHGHKLGTDYLAKLKAEQDPHTKLEDN